MSAETVTKPEPQPKRPPRGWPALMCAKTAIEYLDGKESRLYALIAHGCLDPMAGSGGKRNVDFLRTDIDRGLKIAAMNAIALSHPAGLKSVEQAQAWREKNRSGKQS